jgi:hypothetical protein
MKALPKRHAHHPQRPCPPSGSAVAHSRLLSPADPLPLCHNPTLQYQRLPSVTTIVLWAKESRFIERFTCQEGKRCMLVFLKLGAHFSRGCAGRRIGHLPFVTHPRHAAISGGSMPASYMVILASANTYSLLQYLVARNRPRRCAMPGWT